jgi:uncharacterized protein (TIGR03118 family)
MPYRQRNLVSNVPLVAKTIDTKLQNPIGIVIHNDHLFVADNVTSVVSEYTFSGSLIQTISCPTNPTGLVVNRNRNAFLFAPISSSTSTIPAILIAVTQAGQIEAWNPLGSSTSFTVVLSTTGQVYYGVTIVEQTSKCSSPLLFVTNFAGSQVQIYNSSFSLVSTFTDSALVADGYSPLNVAAFHTNFCDEDGERKQRHHEVETPLVMVTFAAITSPSTIVPGLGNGFIDVFSISGQLISRYANRGSLNVPYGLIIRQDGILVANHGSGAVLKYTTKSVFSTDTGSTLLKGEFETSIRTPCEGTILNDGIWSLALCATSHDEAQIFFTAGLNSGKDGLVGSFVTEEEVEEKESKRIKDPESSAALESSEISPLLMSPREKPKRRHKRKHHGAKLLKSLLGCL